jgi:hypothetical protein
VVSREPPLIRRFARMSKFDIVDFFLPVDFV